MATTSERQKKYLENLRDSGGRRISIDFSAERLALIEKIKKRDKIDAISEVLFSAIEQLAKPRK